MTKREVEEYIMSQIFPNASHEVTAQNVRNAFAPIVERVWTFLEGEIGDLSQLQTTDKQSVVNAINAVLSKLNHDITLTKQEIDNIGSKVGELEEELNNATTYKESDLDEGYYNLTGTKPSTIGPNPDFYCLKIEVKQGQIAHLTTTGGGNARAYALTDNNKIITERAEPSAKLENLEIKIIQDGWLYVNCRTIQIAEFSLSVGSAVIPFLLDEVGKLKTNTIPDAPKDGGLYARKDGAWEKIKPVEVDATLSQSGKAGDAKTIGDAIIQLRNDVQERTSALVAQNTYTIQKRIASNQSVGLREAAATIYKINCFDAENDVKVALSVNTPDSDTFAGWVMVVGEAVKNNGFLGLPERYVKTNGVHSPYRENFEIDLLKGQTLVITGDVELTILSISSVAEAVEQLKDITYKLNSFADTTPCEIIRHSLPLSTIVKDFCAIGSSSTAGQIFVYKKATDSEAVGYTDNDNSWAKVMSRLINSECQILAQPGATCKTWLNQFGNALTAHSLYFVFLGMNDRNASAYSGGLGSISDVIVGNEDLNPDTFYGYYSKIIAKIRSVQPNSLIISMNIPRGYSNEGDDSEQATINRNYNKAIKEVAQLYPHVILMDLYEYAPRWYDGMLEMRYGHLTPMGYNYFGLIVGNYLEWLVCNEREEFNVMTCVGTGYYWNKNEAPTQ